MQRVLPVLAVVCFFIITNCLFAQNAPTIFCPSNINEFLDPGECETEVNFQMSASSNGNSTSPLIVQIDGTGYSSGDVFPMGITTLQFAAYDTASPMPFPADTCTFNVSVVEYTPTTSVIVTDDDLWISIPPECEMYLLPSMVLEGNYGCYDDFVVDVENTGNNHIGPSYVGETISYVIRNTETGVMGWGEVTIEDKAGPYIQNCDTVRVGCLADTKPASEGGDIAEPDFTDCYDFTVYYQDVPTPGTCQDTFAMHILRFWTAVDELGNVSSCNQIIIVDRTLLTDIEPNCPADTMIECSLTSAPNFSPEVTGYPTVEIDGEVYDITKSPSICNITSQYNDMTIDGCGNTFKIIRTWTIMDWCLPIQQGVNPWTCTQSIAFMDTTPPIVSTPSDMTVSANLPGCRAKPTIPSVSVQDCSGYSVFIFTPAGPIPANGGVVPAPGLKLGTHNIEVRVTDECGNMTTVKFKITVVDQIQPTPVCDKHTVTSLDNTGYSYVLATSIDDGSTDNCCIEGFEIRRLSDNCGNPDNLTFGEYIEFCCEDVGQTIAAVMRVWDCYGNSNTCQVEIEVQDIHGPQITCPPDVTLNCGDDINDPTLVGTVETDPALQGPLDGLAMDNCNPVEVISLDIGQVDCGGGTIKRTYTATDPAGTTASCLQTITVVNNNQYTGTTINFPADITLNSCMAMTDPAITGVPTYPPATECFQLMHGQEPDLVLSSSGGACVKIQRKWFVIDWCQFDPNNPNSPGRWERTQTIVVMDQEGPTFPVCDNLTFCNFKADCSDLAPNLTVSATDACTADNLLTYSWTVDLYNDGQPGPAGYVTSGTGQNTTNNYPIGSHRITYTAHDGCGNSGQCSFIFTIDDCKAPTASCMSGLIIGIMQTGMVPVNVSQMESGSSSDNCTDRDDLTFSFNQFSLVEELIFDCDDLGNNAVTVWVTDEAGNKGSCTTSVTIQDNMNACGGNPLIQPVTGAVKDETDKGVAEVSVELNGNMVSTIFTDTFGLFTFDNVPMGEDYTVTPVLDTDPLNGVTTYDLYLMSRHILGIEFLDSPYKIIAADVNRSGTVTTFDVVETRRVILHVVPTFPSNTSWRFVDANYTFPNPANPFAEPFPEVCNINNLTANSPAPNFVAIKTADLNQSATTNVDAPAEDRNNKALTFYCSDKYVKKSEQVTVSFETDLTGFLAHQFTLGFDQEKIELSDILPGNGMSASDFGTAHLDKGLLTAAWFQTEKMEVGRATAFQLVFTAKADGQLSDLLHLNSRLTKAASFDKDGNAYDVKLLFGTDNGGLTAGDFQLFQNVPNPFDNATVIGFRLPTTSNATLTIYDAAGKTLKTINGQYAQGYHEVAIENGLLPAKGVYYYRLETPEHTATMKMTKL